MLIRVVCAIKEKKMQADLEKRLSDLDVQLKFCDRQKSPWQELARSCADVFIVSSLLIPKPVESSISILNNLPEKPITIVLHNRESSEEHANLLASGVDVVLYSGISFDSMIEVIESTLESRRQFYYMDRFDQRGRYQPRLNDFVSNSKEMQMFLDEAQQIVTSDASLLLLGETGVGKEHLSKAIHAESHRSSGPFIAINMAAIPEQLIESELFGHEQGAFTGAVRSRRGAFEMAHTGTIFLDEIGEMPLQMQTKLLRVLQDFEFTPVGGEKPVWVDVRVIAATNKNLEKEIKKGQFRQDLYYRLGVITLTIPPLRRRKEDIPALANHFLSVYNKKIGCEINRFSNDAMKALCTYQWPGNIRELMNVIERAVILCKSDTISIENFPSIFHKKSMTSPAGFDINDLDLNAWKNKTLSEAKQEILHQVEKKYLEMVLEKTGGKIGETARIAGIHPRGLYGKMKILNIDKATFKSKDH
ncbi:MULTISPECIES: sigma-54 interaction domain-containing protein [Desulfobacula]|uniref:Sigma54 specific transcriptional regulator, Fis family n=2 Tax=Desulfobacula TaxID=28222 RepID=K0NFL2_DESTT|nr:MULTISPECIES: sigma-54 dependent transcriptional regulator [Desulfobacula]CCK78493.1 sigma54 specific transcriptional regulator, Fis family [Desulfobacula toluolica Tol2]SDU52767.1 DNA-binding transcriptional response regulator, NtrC family, contains REC, AAA-type ATPase, and a Fis-type DNA-binding domains [Desulfobacula phenolica]